MRAKEMGRIEADRNRQNAELIFYCPGDLILDVWNMKIRLLRAVRTASGCGFKDVLSPAAYGREDVQEWLEQALDACGGFINRSGYYPLVVPAPEWLEPEITIAALGR